MYIVHFFKNFTDKSYKIPNLSNQNLMRYALRLTGIHLAALAILLLTSACTSMIVNSLLHPLELSLQKQTDLELIRDGAPSLLLLLDGLIINDPDNKDLLMTATRAYGSYAASLHEYGETERAIGMSLKARDYGITLLNLLPGLKSLDGMSIVELGQILSRYDKKHVPSLFWSGYGWATWIRYQSGTPASMADLPIIEQIMQRVVELDEAYYYGGAHIFLGTYYGSRPAMFGGKPAESRQHFEQALTISNRHFLLTQVAYAETYARMAFDRELYKNLLTEVLNHSLQNDELASSNQLAKMMASKLLDQVDQFF